MVVDLQSTPSFRAGPPRVLLRPDGAIGRDLRVQYDVALDGRRFLMVGCSRGDTSPRLVRVEHFRRTLRGERTRDSRPSWSPAGRRIAVNTVEGGTSAIVTIPADGSGPAEPVTDGQSSGAPFWSRDGNWIPFDGQLTSAANGEDVYAVQVTGGGERRAVPVVATPATEETGALSPDGRWVAYAANEAGPTQVFIRPFMRPGGRWLVSTGEATGPLWTTDTELVYWDADTKSLIAATLAYTPEPRVTKRTSLIDDWRAYVPSGRSELQYDISDDGQHVLALRVGAAPGLPSPVVVLDWVEEVWRLTAQR